MDVPVGSLLSSMAVFVPCDRKLQRAYLYREWLARSLMWSSIENFNQSIKPIHNTSGLSDQCLSRFLWHEIEVTRIISTPSGWNTSPLQGYPQHWVRRYPFVYLGEERHCESNVSYPRIQRIVSGQGSNPDEATGPPTWEAWVVGTGEGIYDLANWKHLDVARVCERGLNWIERVVTNKI